LGLKKMSTTNIEKPQQEANISDLVRSFRRIDLNLFIVFVTIYEYRSLTIASKHLGLTQPAVSHSLSRLREALGDDLFMRKGGKFVPTPFSHMIIDDVRRSLEIIRVGPLGQQVFDPLASDARFRIAMNTAMEVHLLPELMKKISVEAPNVVVSTHRVQRRSIENELATGELSLALDVDMPTGPEIKRLLVGVDSPVVVARKGNPLFKDGMTPEAFLKADHVIVTARKRGVAIEDYELGRRGERRRIAVRCTTLMAALKVVANTDYALSLGGDQLQAIAPNHELQEFKFPYDVKPIGGMLYWHESVDQVSSNVWMRNLILQTLSSD
jgi:DNA-binding transcriptional LysR family regulator